MFLEVVHYDNLMELSLFEQEISEFSVILLC